MQLKRRTKVEKESLFSNKNCFILKSILFILLKKHTLVNRGEIGNEILLDKERIVYWQLYLLKK